MGGWDGPSSSVWQWPVERMRPNRSCHSICDPHPCSIAPLLLQEQNWATEKWAKGNVLTNQIDDSLAKSRATKRPNVWVERHFLEPMPSLNHPICMNMALWKSAPLLSSSGLQPTGDVDDTKSDTTTLSPTAPSEIHRSRPNCVSVEWKHKLNTCFSTREKIQKSKHLSFFSSSKINKGQNLLLNLSLCKRDLQ